MASVDVVANRDSWGQPRLALMDRYTVDPGAAFVRILLCTRLTGTLIRLVFINIPNPNVSCQLVPRQDTTKGEEGDVKKKTKGTKKKAGRVQKWDDEKGKPTKHPPSSYYPHTHTWRGSSKLEMMRTVSSGSYQNSDYSY